MGQGSDTVMAQIAGEVLGLQTEDILVIHPDTDVTPYDMATLGSRSTFHMGKAVKAAAEDVRAQVLATAAGILETDIAELVVFLISDRARWITGTEIVIDGGYSLR